MSDEPPHMCEGMARALADLDVPVLYFDRFREYSIRVEDGGSASLTIDYCPFCGTELPSSLRLQWFDRLDQLGLEPESSALPLDLRTGAWWRRPPEPIGR
ncbi:hypothetical protein SAMN05444157_2811 [Frankineae bacterium MT45]|nr:hypothetical protein SAMN05444157_2811 [Frankineae bacterium MT45]